MKKSNSPNTALEINFDGLVGPTHNYAGLSHGNVASKTNRNQSANPRDAALQGLEKMRYVASRGIPQAILPPQGRPDLAWLQRLGFSGKAEAMLEKVAKADPVLLAAAWSASSMWTANAATISPSVDSDDGKVHITPANLSSQIHRSLESTQTAMLLKHIFPGDLFVHHAPLPKGRFFGDEGAANHIRLAPNMGSEGIEIFVYGNEATVSQSTTARRFIARQSLEASKAVSRLHGLNLERTLFVAQNPVAIDAGVFHNDVISVGHLQILFCHESAFQNRLSTLRELRKKYASLGHGEMNVIEVKSREVSLADAVSTYLFNSQILSLPGGGMLLLAAEECRRNKHTRHYLENLPAQRKEITEVTYVDLRQSMRNGGGPACLRLRALLTAKEWNAVPSGVKFTEALYLILKTWIEKNYRDRLLPKDLADPVFFREVRKAMQALHSILIYV